MKKIIYLFLLITGVISYAQTGARKVVIAVPTAITISGDKIDATGYGKANGYIANFEVTGGSPGGSTDYTITWTKDGLALTPNLNQLSSGNYTVSVTDSKNCINSRTFTINQPEELKVTITGTPFLCFGDNTGNLSVTNTSGGTVNSGYTYEWYKKDNSNSFNSTYKIGATAATDLYAGIYKVKVTDNASPANEAWSNEFEITQSTAKLNAPFSQTNVSCNGGNNGTITITITGGTPGYSVLWNDGVTTQNRSGLAISNYSYTITDASGCQYKSPNDIIITQPSQPTINNISQTEPTSPTAQDGLINIGASGGTGSYTYVLKKDNTTIGYSSNAISNLVNGTYEVWIKDANGCISISKSIVLESLNLALVSKENIQCYGASTGNIVVIATGGKGSGYNYQWYKMEAAVENILTGKTNASISGLNAGTYRVKVDDGINPEIFMNVDLTQPSSAISASVIQTNVNCFGGTDGTASITVSGGTPDNGIYTYQWKKDGVLLPTITTATSNTLSAGNYSVIVKDKFLCSFEKTFSITAPNAITIPTPAIPAIRIFGQSTGTITFSADPSGGNGNYTYEWKSATDISFLRNTKNISGLTAGFYTLVVKDNTNCSTSKTFEVTQNPKLSVAINETQFIKCYGDANGELTADVMGGIPPYKYIWKKGSQILTSQNNQNLSGLSFGTYSVSVTDSANPEPAGPFAKTEQLDYPLTQPEKLAVTFLNQTNVLCYNTATGTINIAISGGTAPYTQQWTKNGINYSTQKDLVNLEAGFYNVTVTDAVGHDCNAVLSLPVVITQPFAPLKIANVIKTNLTGFETNNGKIEVSVSGGTPNYVYEWRKNSDATIISSAATISDLSIGTYHLIVKDGNNCTLPQADYVITQPDKLEITSLIQTPNTAIRCYGDSPTEFTATVTGGVKDYVFEWRNTTTGIIYSSTEIINATNTVSKASNLGAGDYSISIIDKNNNILFGTNKFSISQPEKLAFTHTQNNVSCFNGNNGEIQLHSTGGIINTDSTKPYTIICTSGTIDLAKGTVSDLSVGTYTVKIIDFNNCQTPEQTIVITEPQNSIFIATEVITPTTGYGLATGKITITVAGGTPGAGYTYVWKDSSNSTVGTNSPVLSNLLAGKYSVLVTDANGCTTTNSYTIDQPTKPIVTENHLQAKCNSLFGSLEAIATGGATFGQNQSERIYSYRLVNKTTGTQTTITDTIAHFTTISDGDYSLTALDSGGVISEAVNITFLQPTPIVINLTSKSNVNCFGGQDGAISIVASGGTGTYTYIWKKGTEAYGTNSPNITGLQQGDYFLEVRDENYIGTDENHCVGKATFTISQPLAILTMDSSSKTDVTGFNLANGTISVNIIGGTTDYSYNWTKINDASFVTSNSNSLTQLSPGEYKVIVNDKNNCTIDKSFTIVQPSLLSIDTKTSSVNCFSDKTGIFHVVATGGVPNNEGFYEYQLFDINQVLLDTQLVKEATFQSLYAANYYIQVTDANGNKMPQDLIVNNQISITQPQEELQIILINKTDVTCPREADGTITIEVKGGTSPYEYVWKNITANNTNIATTTPTSLQALPSGEYEVTITDFNGCMRKKGVVITEPEDFGFDKEKFTLIKPTISIPYWSVNIFMKGGENDYNYILKASNGSILINKVISNQSLFVDNLPADIYTISVTDNTGCTKTDTIDLLGNVLDITLTQTKQIICNGDGANFKAIVKGGIGIINYTWFKDDFIIVNEKETSISGYGPGSYKVAVIDSDKNEVISDIITIIEPDIVAITSSSATNPSCSGVNDAIVKLTASGGNGIYQFSYETNKWINFSNSTSTDISGLSPGTYDFYVKDTNGCMALAKKQLIISAIPLLEIVKSDISNTTGFGLSNGSISITANGGNGDYQYQWFTENRTNINQTSNIAKNLIAGNYYVVVTDTKGCKTTSTIFNVTEPNNLLVDVAEPTVAIACFGDKSIQLNAIVSGGVSSYTYQWFDANNILIGNNLLSPQLGAGSYFVKVVDTNQNQATSNNIIITEPTLIIVNSSFEDAKCYGESNGSVTLTAQGGSNSFSYNYQGQWIPFTNAKTTICSGLAAGTYLFKVKDTQGTICSNVPNIYITIVQPKAVLGIDATKTIIKSTSGFGLSNGSISITAQGGNGGYIYNWYKENGTTINQTTSTAINLIAGNYYVVITDAKGCSLTSPLLEVTEPTLLENSIVIQNTILCHGDKNGSLKPASKGGFLKPGENYTYQWYQENNATVLATSTILGSIGIGTYYAIVTDSNGNIAKSNTITLTEPPVLGNILAADYTLCGDANDWTITTTPIGGTPPYNYFWNTGAKSANLQNVPFAKYSVLVTDSNGCTISKDIQMIMPLPLKATEKIIIPTCYAGSDASINLTCSGGKAPYNYVWNTGEKSNVLSGVSAGNYSVIITDDKGCVINKSYTIGDPPKDVIDLGQDVTLCFGQSLTVNATVIDSKATYSWISDKGFVSDKPIITISEPANYTLTVTNKLGCKASDTLQLSSQNTAISAEFAVSSQAFLNEKIEIVDISNPEPDSIEWVLPPEATILQNNKDFAEISFSKAGEYELTLKTKKGNCNAQQTKTIVITNSEYVDPNNTDSLKNFGLKIYPNPSNGIFTVDVSLDKVMSAHVKIYNLSNNIIVDSKYEDGKDNYLFNFNLSGLSAGFYFVLLETQQGSKLRKIIIN